MHVQGLPIQNFGYTVHPLENRYHACSGPPHPELWVHCSPLGEQIPCMFRASPSRTLGTLFTPWRTDTMHVQGLPIQHFGYTIHPLENRYHACSGPPHPALWVHCSPLGEQIPCMFTASPSSTLGTLFTPWRTDTMHVQGLPIQHFGYTVHPLENRYHACSGPPHPALWVHCSPLGEQLPCMFTASPSSTLGTLFTPWRTDTMHVQGLPIQNFGYTVHPLENRYHACSGPPHPALWVHCSPLSKLSGFTPGLSLLYSISTLRS